MQVPCLVSNLGLPLGLSVTLHLKNATAISGDHREMCLLLEILLFPSGEYLPKNQILSEKSDVEDHKKLFWLCALWPYYKRSVQFCQSQNDEEAEEEVIISKSVSAGS